MKNFWISNEQNTGKLFTVLARLVNKGREVGSHNDWL